MMKNSAALFIVLAIVGIFWVIMVITRPSPDMHAQESEARSALNQKLLLAGREENHLKILERTLDQLNGMSRASQPLSKVLAENGDQSADQSTTQSNMPVANKTAPTASPNISLVYISSDIRKAVIDGNSYKPGDKMPDGGRLISITEQRIVISQPDGQRKVISLEKSPALGNKDSK